MRRVRHGKGTSTGGWQHVGDVAKRIQANIAYLRFIERATKPVPVESPEPAPEPRS